MKAINLDKTKSFQSELDELTLYYEANQQKKSSEDVLKSLKPTILKLIEEGKGNNGLYEAIKTIRETKSLDEEKLLEIIKEFLSDLRFEANNNFDKMGLYHSLKLLNIIKTKEYIDNEALEKAIYNNLIDPKLLEPAQSIKESVVLTVKGVK